MTNSSGIFVDGHYIDLSEIPSVENDTRDWCKVYFKNGRVMEIQRYSYIMGELRKFNMTSLKV